MALVQTGLAVDPGWWLGNCSAGMHTQGISMWPGFPPNKVAGV